MAIHPQAPESPDLLTTSFSASYAGVVAFIAVATVSLALGPVVHSASLEAAMTVAVLADLVLTVAVAVLLVRHPVPSGGTDASPRP